jgi:cyclopentanol dehydrogenase
MSRTVVVTGGGRGIGRAIARAFAEPGAHIVITSRTASQLERTAAEIRATGAQATAIPMDVTDEANVAHGFGTLHGLVKEVHVLVNNAGIGATPGRVEDMDLESWERVMAVNARGVFLGTKHAIPAMRRAGGGSIVNISSQLGLVGMDNISPQYPASKGAVRLLTKVTALQYAKEGIRVNSVHPGPIITPMTEPRRRDAATYALMRSRIPMGRYGEADEVAYGVLYLASDESSWTTGSELVIDGGWTAQ